MQTTTTSDAGPKIGPDRFRQAMLRNASGVVIVTTCDPLGFPVGAVVTAFAPVADTSPTVLVCIDRDAPIRTALTASGVFCANLLAAGSAGFAAAFREPALRRALFASRHDWLTLETGAPALRDAAASLDCEVLRTVEEGSQSIVLGRVVGLRLRADPGDPLVRWNGGYGHVQRMED